MNDQQRLPVPILERAIHDATLDAANGVESANSFMEEFARRMKAAEKMMLRERLALLEGES
jgi:hypothetical protein